MVLPTGKVLTHRLHTFTPFAYSRLGVELGVTKVHGKLLCKEGVDAHFKRIRANCSKRYVMSSRSSQYHSREVLSYGPVAQRLVQGTHSESCAARRETSCGMVSKSANPNVVLNDDGNAEPSPKGKV